MELFFDGKLIFFFCMENFLYYLFRSFIEHRFITQPNNYDYIELRSYCCHTEFGNMTVNDIKTWTCIIYFGTFLSLTTTIVSNYALIAAMLNFVT